MSSLTKAMMVATGLLVAGQSQAVYTIDNGNRTIATFGSSSGGDAYVIFTPPISDTQCLYGLVYTPSLNTAAGKALFGTTMSIASSGLTVTRVDYDRDPSSVPTANKCTMTVISF